MNLYFRLIKLLIRIFFRRGDMNPMEPSYLKFRVLPSDCDPNFHLNNARYISFMDLGRFNHFGSWQVIKTIFLQHKYLAVIGSLNMTYIKELPPFAVVNLETKIIGWDEKYFYFEQKFRNEKDQLCTIGLARAIFIKSGQGPVPTDTVISHLPYDQQESPPLPEPVMAWKNLLDAKRRHSAE